MRRNRSEVTALGHKDRLELNYKGPRDLFDIESNLSENIKLYCSGEFGLKPKREHDQDNYEEHDPEVELIMEGEDHEDENK